MKHYLIAMGIRTASFPVAVWAFTEGWYAVSLVAAVAAIFIPSFAVMLVNAVDRRTVVSEPVRSPVRGLGTGSSASAGASSGSPAGSASPAGAGGVAADVDAPLTGTIISRQDTAYPPHEGEPGRREAS